MKRIRPFSLLILAFLLTAISARAEESPSPSPDPAYGVYPQNYKVIVNRWLESHLVDPVSAVVEWLGEPKSADVPIKGGAPLRGYLVEIRVNSRNRFGAPTGKQKYKLLIRDGQVIKANGF